MSPRLPIGVATRCSPAAVRAASNTVPATANARERNSLAGARSVAGAGRAEEWGVRVRMRFNLAARPADVMGARPKAAKSR